MSDIDYKKMAKAVRSGVIGGLIDFAFLALATWMAIDILREVLS